MTSALPTGTLTFLFTDIEGSTARWERQRETMSAALVRHDALVRAAIEDHRGHVFKTVGDAFYAAFADAADALAAALDAQRALAREDWDAFGTDFADLRVRMAIHVGFAEARGGDYFGPELNRTARLMAAGHGGQVLLSLAAQQVVRDFLPDDVLLRDLGEHRLKDLRHSEHIYQVLAPGVPEVLEPLAIADLARPHDRIIVDETGAERSLADTLSALLAAVRSETAAVTLTAPEVRQVLASRPRDLTEYRLARIAEWIQPRYRLDGRFVALTLLVDQGEGHAAGRWMPTEARHGDLGGLLAAVPDMALVVLGPPGSGKTTLLRHLELDTAIANLRGEEAGDTVTFFMPLNQYRGGEPGRPPPSPERWLAARWAAAYPAFRQLDDLLAEGRVILLLDGLNEMPASSEAEFRERVGWWKDWLDRLAKEKPGNRVVFSCRTLDYSAPLSTAVLRVPQVLIEALGDVQVKEFLHLYSPVRGEEIWSAIAGKPQLDALRAPFFLALLVDQVEATGELAEDRAALFTAFVRQALKREIERGNPLFAVEELLSSRDIRRVAQWQWRDAYDLPERGGLLPKLAALAYAMQATAADGERSQVGATYDAAVSLLDHPLADHIIQAGEDLGVLDEDQPADEVHYRHQLLQEFFAARVLAATPRPALVAASWRAADSQPGLSEVLDTVLPADTLPALPASGWEETTLLAAAMAGEPEPFVRALMPHNLVVAGQAARLPTVRGRLSTAFLHELRWALARRSRDREADLRARIDAGLALGWLGDPRFERRPGPYGEYLAPPMVMIPGGMYPIGEDEAIEWTEPRSGQVSIETDHVPRHEVAIAAFHIGQFAVTNAEWACFMAAGGYDEPRWWTTADARRWQGGELANEGAKVNNRMWRQRFSRDPTLIDRMVAEGGFANQAAAERWRAWMALDDAGFEQALDSRWQPQRRTAPAYWRDERYNRPSQPVAGVCWYEVRAYCAWLSAQTGGRYRLPTEVEWEAAARGLAGRPYPWGAEIDGLPANTDESHVRQTTPVGVFPEGDTPEGVADMAGNLYEWTSSLWGEYAGEGTSAGYRYPYDPTDGREQPEAPPLIARVVRGSSWSNHLANSRAAIRVNNQPDFGGVLNGFRLATSPP